MWDSPEDVGAGRILSIENLDLQEMKFKLHVAPDFLYAIIYHLVSTPQC